MRRILAFAVGAALCVALAPEIGLAQNDQPEVVWSHTFGSPAADMAYSVQQTRDGGYILAGYTEPHGTRPPGCCLRIPILNDMAQSAQESEKPVYTKEQIAILDVGGNVETWIKESFYSKLEVQLSKLGRFRIIPKRNIKQAYEELALSQTGIIDEKQALRVGRFIKAEVLVRGTIDNLVVNFNPDTKFFEVQLTATVTLLEVKHESTLSSFQVTGEYEHDNKATAILGGIDGSVELAMQKMRQVFPLRGRIIGVHNDEVFINVGRADGVKKGMMFDVYGTETESSAILKVTYVSEKFAKARIKGRSGKIEPGYYLRERTANPTPQFTYLGTGVASGGERSRVFVEIGAEFTIYSELKAFPFLLWLTTGGVYAGATVNLHLKTGSKGSAYVGIGKLYKLDMSGNRTIREISFRSKSLRFFLSLIDEDDVRLGIAVYHDFVPFFLERISKVFY